MKKLLKNAVIIFIAISIPLIGCKKDKSKNTAATVDYYDDNYFTIDGKTIYMEKTNSATGVANSTVCINAAYGWVNGLGSMDNSMLFSKTTNSSFITVYHKENGVTTKYTANKVDNLIITNSGGHFDNVELTSESNTTIKKMVSGRITCK